ncbi:hypothetical protein BCR44DRAFT_1268660 [Catenaria anguillulae PL171]|uniref:Uncharacterized protein n=1 Tax=Catenaria anguillulae PL171 TaxID=765915 RepID=A0A1Y2HX50_9FUNG|nr:hypothetical protein BCR44DRAFT_1268660 [Catenaria anguillulae PL171]
MIYCRLRAYCLRQSKTLSPYPQRVVGDHSTLTLLTHGRHTELPKLRIIMAEAHSATAAFFFALKQHTRGFFQLSRQTMEVVLPMLVTAVIAAAINCGTEYFPKTGDVFPRVEVAYEHVGWAIIHFLHRTLFSIVYAPIATDRIADIINGVGLFFSSVFAVCTYSGISTSERAAVVDEIPKSVMGTIFGHWAYIYCQIVMLISFKVRVMIMDRKYPGRLPAQISTPIFFCVQLCFILYYLSYWAVPIIYIFAGVFVCVIGTTTYLIKMRTQFHVLSRQFDMSFFFMSAYHAFRLLTRTLTNLLQDAKSDFAFTAIMLAYRSLVSFLVVQADETVEMAFGVNNMWISFPYRLAETVAVGNITMDKMDSLITDVSYLVINLLVTLAKDSGLIDDFRFLYIHRFNVFYYNPPSPSRSSSAQAISASSTSQLQAAQPSQAGSSSGPESSLADTLHGKDGKLTQLPAVAIIRGSTTELPPSPVIATSNQAVTVASTADLQLAAPPSVSFAPSQSDLSNTCASQSKTSKAKKAPGMVELRHPLHKITQDLRAQVMRSEQAFVARLVGIIGYVLAFLVAWSLGFPKTRHVTHKDHTRAARAVGILLAEVLIARVLAVVIFSYKIHLHERLVQSMSLVGGGHGSKGIRSRTVTNASVGKSGLSEAHKSNESLQTNRSEGKASTNGSTVGGGGGKTSGKHGWAKQPIRLWTTQLPQHTRVRRLTVLGSVFIIYTMFGTWG